MATIPRETIDRLRDRALIEDVVQHYFPLKRAGHYWKALCPFHDEKSPSFVVSPGRRIYKCFGCGQAGDAIDFVMRMDRLSFVEAVEVLADRFGVTIERVDEEREGPSRRDLLRALDWAQRMFRKAWSSPEALPCREYVASRGFSADTVASFGFGYSLPGGRGLVTAARAANVPMGLMEAVGLATPRALSGTLGDLFFDARLVFPIREPQGSVIGFGARTLDGSEPKYKNSPESALFHKGRVLYGLDRLRERRHKGPIFVVEGYTDVMMAEQCGIPGVVAALGTALTTEHARLLARYTDKVVLLFDGDGPGLKAAEAGTRELIAAGHLDLEAVELPGGQDPCDYFREHGAQSAERLAERQEPVLDFVLRRARLRHGNDTEGRLHAVKDLSGLVAKVDDPIARDLLAERVARDLSMPSHRVQELVNGLRVGPRFTRSTGRQNEVERAEPTRQTPIDRAESALLECLVNAPELIARVEERHLELLEPGAVRDLVARLRALAPTPGAPITVVLDLGRELGLSERLAPLVGSEDGSFDRGGRLEEALRHLDNTRRVSVARSLRDRWSRSGDGDVLGKLQETYRALKRPSDPNDARRPSGQAPGEWQG